MQAERQITHSIRVGLLEVEQTMASPIAKFTNYVNAAYRNDFLERMMKQRQYEQFTDVTLKSGDYRAICHRSVLAAVSPYFHTMFTSGLPDSEAATVTLTIDPAALKLVVDYIYSGKIKITVDNVQSLVESSDLLLLDDLKAACDQFLSTQVNSGNRVRMYTFAYLYRLKLLQGIAKRVMTADFMSVVSTSEFRELPCKELIDYISDDDVDVDTEDVVFEAVLNWVRHDPDERKSFLMTILEHVRLQFCTRSYLDNVVECCEVLTPETRAYLRMAQKFRLSSAPGHSGTCHSDSNARTSYREKRRLLVVGGQRREENNKCINYWREDRESWELLANLPQSVGKTYSVCILDNGLLVTGGRQENDSYGEETCWKFDFQTIKWMALPPLNTARHCHGSVELGSAAYVVGGYSTVSLENRGFTGGQRLNHNLREWSSVADMPTKLCEPLVVGHAKGFYVFDNTKRSLATLFFTIDGKWRTLSSMPEGCICASAVMLNGFVYLVGGATQLCQRYDAATDSWAKLSKPLHAFGYASAVVWHGHILLAGGGNDRDKSTTIKQYDYLTGQWSDWQTKLHHRLSRHSMFSVDI